MRKVRLGLISFAVFALTSCSGFRDSVSYQPPSIILPAHIKSIAVRPFENQTAIPSIGNKLWLATTDEFIRDGRIAYVDSEEKADGVVIGKLTQYQLTILSQDVNLVAREYQIRVLMDLSFLDRANHQLLWQEPALEQKIRFFAETQPGGLTEEQAREDLWRRFATDIVRRTIEGFGSVTSLSPKAIPKEPVPENSPPEYPTTAPY